MKKKAFASLVLAAVLTVGVFSGCGKKEEAATKSGEKFTFTAGVAGADNERWKNDDYYKYISDKLNIDIDFVAMSQADAQQKARIWINSGDMPDVLLTTFKYDEYTKFAKQGLIRALPADYAKQHKGVDFALKMTGIDDKYLSVGSKGEKYGIIRPVDGYTPRIQEFRDAYENGEDLSAKMNEDGNVLIDGYGFAYRKDWAEKLGIKTSEIMEYEDFLNMVRAFKKADLGGVGKENTVGITVDYTEAPNIFVTAFNSSYKYFHKRDGKYVCGYTEPETAAGVEAYANAYREGLLSPDFFTLKSQDLDSQFCVQKSGVIFPRCDVGGFMKLKTAFKNANPDLVPEDCIGMCWIKSPDGKVHGREAANYYSCVYFNPKLSDEKMNKILDVMDYVVSPEGGPQIELGVPDVDYKIENGKYIVTREKKENGEFVAILDKYPSNKFFGDFIKTLFDRYAFSLDQQAVNSARSLEAEKRKNELSLLEVDFDLRFYNAEDYTKFQASHEINGMLSEIVVADGDIKTLWNNKVDSIRAEAEAVAENMNKNILGK